MLARKIRDQDFEDNFDADEFPSRVIETLTDCFSSFDPARGRADAAAEDRFVAFFRRCFKGGLHRAIRDRKSGERQKATRGDLELKAGRQPSTRKPDVHDQWARVLYREALRRLDGPAQVHVRMHWLEERHWAP